MKYITFLSPEGPRVEIFCAPTTHVEQAKAHPAWQPISAGFVQFLGNGCVRTYGRSESMNLGSAPRDGSLIEVMMSATLKTSSPEPVAA
jgi:hypothetical protein